VLERGGTLASEDLAAYEPVEREPVRARFSGREIVTNAPPSPGGVLIALSLAILERAGRTDLEAIVLAMEEAQATRTQAFNRGLYEDGFAARVLDASRLDAAARRVAAGERVPRGGEGSADRVGSTTHISTLDADGNAASVTCSNGVGSGLIVPGTGVHVNNMLGEEDLNPQGFHRIPPGRRVSSMMAPTLALRDGEVVLGLGSAGSNRIRSAILQTTVRVLEQEMDAEEAVVAGRLHFEAGTVQAEPGVEEGGLSDLERRGVPVVRWRRKNLYFGGAQAVRRDPGSGELSGGGDPRRGGAVAFA
jgi:gamma-glutamyltranspeptidase/glutathione hydrolase